MRRRDRPAYFLAGGRALEAVQAFLAQRKVHLDIARGLARSWGLGEILYQHQGYVVAFSLGEGRAVPEGFKRPGGRSGLPGNAVIFNLKAHLGKTMAAGLAKSRPMGQVALMKALGMEQVLNFQDGGGWTNGVGCELYGDVVILLVSVTEDGSVVGGEPYDSKRLKDSEYWTIREAFGLERG